MIFKTITITPVLKDNILIHHLILITIIKSTLPLPNHYCNRNTNLSKPWWLSQVIKKDIAITKFYQNSVNTSHAKPLTLLCIKQ